MDEFELQDIERSLVDAPAWAAAAVAFAAIFRLGELGGEGGRAFARHAHIASFEPDLLEVLAAGLKALS